LSTHIVLFSLQYLMYTGCFAEKIGEHSTFCKQCEIYCKYNPMEKKGEGQGIEGY